MIQWFLVHSRKHTLVPLGFSSLSPATTTNLFPVPFPLPLDISHKNEIAEYVASCAWCLSLSTAFSSFAHVVVCIRWSLFFFTAEEHSIGNAPLGLSFYQWLDSWVVSTLSLLRCRGHWGTCRVVICVQFANSTFNFSKTRQPVFHGGSHHFTFSQRFWRAKVCGPLLIRKSPCVRG